MTPGGGPGQEGASGLCARFCSSLAALGVQVVADPRQAVAAAGARRVVRWATPACLECDLGGVEVVDWSPDRLGADALRAAAARADLGVADPAWAVAATGTVALPGGRLRSRLVTLLPPAVLFLVRAGSIVANLEDGLALLGEPPLLPSALNLVTGPSRSADIGGELILGVHGPGLVFVHIAGGGSRTASPPPAATG